jgi:predicted GTPase
VLDAAKTLNPSATCYITASEVTVPDPDLIKGKRVLCVDDGPTITHGGMPSGAALVAAEKYGAGEVVDPRGKFTGEMKTTFEKYSHIGPVVPAMGYSEQQVRGGRLGGGGQ